jgi:beta-lactamase regulating signal transducer with metallopeptidase domain
MIFGQSSFLQALGWAVLNSLWQMAFLWVIFQLIFGIFRNATSSQKSSLAASFLIIGFAWFVVTFFSILIASTPGNGAITSTFIDTGSNDQLNDWLNTMLPIASVIYLVLLVLPVFYFIRNYRYVQAIRRYELSKIDVQWRIFVKNVAALMGIKKPVHIWLSGIVTSPVTIGYIKPVILLPLAAINQLSTQQLEAVLLHELAHIRRYDYFINLVIRFIQSVLYFNPFVKALVKTVERERERSCDEIVMQFQYDPHGYASALLTIERTNYLPKPLAVAASGKRNDLLHRIEWLLGVQKKQTISFNKLAGVFAGLLCFITLNALLIISKPVKTQHTVSSLTHLSSPFYFFTESDEEETNPEILPTEIQTTPVINHAQPQVTDNKPKEENTNELNGLIEFAHTALTTSPFINVNFSQPVIPQLKDYQEEQVQEALEASKKVLEEQEWKAVENKIADVMTTHEKVLLKDQYEKAVDQVDWEKMETNLRLAYDKIDWIRVNDELNKAMVEIKMDSLQQVYTAALDELSALKKELVLNKVQGIPDTDISLKAVESNKKNIQKAISNLKKIRTRKIVHL